jgi:hypothetical protein
MGLKFRRGTNAQKSGSLAFGEPYVNTDLGTLQIGGLTGDITLGASGTGSAGSFSSISGSGLDITGNANIAGNVTVGGQLTIGDQTSDTVNVVASLSSSLIPQTTNAFDLGSATKIWKDLYISTGSIKFVEGTTVVKTLNAATLTSLEAATGSSNASITTLNSFTASVNGHIGDINTKTGSFETKFSTLATYTGSNDTTNTTQNGRLTSIEAATGSYETKGRGIVSGSSQIDVTLTQKYTTLATTGSNTFNGAQSINGNLNVTGSATYTGTSVYNYINRGANGNDGLFGFRTNGTDNWLIGERALSNNNFYLYNYGTSNNAVTVDYTTSNTTFAADATATNFIGGIKANNGIVSGSAQLTSLLPTGTVSGSSQVTLSSTTGYSTTINQNLLTTSNVQHASLGIGMVASGTAGRIDASGDIVAYSTSDINFKENITPIENAIEKIKMISGNTYDWKADMKEFHGFEGNDVGVIAQEIEAVLPQLVTTRETGYKAVKYDKLVALLIEGIKTQQNQIDNLTIEIEKLKESKGL